MIVKATEKRKGYSYIRDVTDPRKRCYCPSLKADQTAAKIMDLQGAENLFNLIKTELKNQSRESGWPRSKEQNATRIASILDNVPKQWFRSTMSSLPTRWKEVIRRKGNLCNFYIAKQQ